LRIRGLSSLTKVSSSKNRCEKAQNFCSFVLSLSKWLTTNENLLTQALREQLEEIAADLTPESIMLSD
jgi:hypothetical protein